MFFRLCIWWRKMRHLPLLSSESLPLTCGEALTSFCDYEEKQTNSLLFLKRPEEVETQACLKENHTNLISCIAFPSPLHDLLKALCISDRGQWVSGWCLLRGEEVLLNSSVTFWTPHLLPLQSLLLFFLEMFLPLQPLTLGLLAGFGFSLLPLKNRRHDKENTFKFWSHVQLQRP